MSARRPTLMIVEDEPFARERLTRLVRELSEFELIAVCSNGNEAIAALKAAPIDIVLLDIEMPGLDGMTVLQHSHSIMAPPLMILTTAHAQFAIAAFAEQAVDYLLKPFDAARLDQALHAAKARLQARAALGITDRVRAALGELDEEEPHTSPAPSAGAARSLLVRQNGRIRLLRAEQIDWIEADGRHCTVHCGSTVVRVDGPLCKLAERLNGERFLAVSRSSLINVDRLVELQEMCKGNMVAVLRGGVEVAVSRRYRARILAHFKYRE